MKTPLSKASLCVKKNYLAMIRNSEGTKMFRDVFVENDKKIKNVTRRGALSCAIFVSSILYLFNLIQEIHTTVKGTIHDMKKFGWYEISQPKQGSVLLWEKFSWEGKDEHYHLGFYLGNQKAISNDYKKRTPQVHHFTFQDKRKIEKIFWHKKLEK